MGNNTAMQYLVYYKTPTNRLMYLAKDLLEEMCIFLKKQSAARGYSSASQIVLDTHV